MPRKKKSQGLPPWLVVLFLLLIAAGSYYALSQRAAESSLRTVEELSPSLYYENANALRGNTYKADVTIASALGNSPTKGRLFSVELKQGGGLLPVLVPPALGNLTIQKGQHYLMKVKVIEGGLLQLEEAFKP